MWEGQYAARGSVTSQRYIVCCYCFAKVSFFDLYVLLFHIRFFFVLSGYVSELVPFSMSELAAALKSTK